MVTDTDADMVLIDGYCSVGVVSSRDGGGEDDIRGYTSSSITDEQNWLD